MNCQQQHNTASDKTQGAEQSGAEQTPAFQFSVLTCKRSQLATKIIYADGSVRPYDNARQFLFDYKKVDCLEDFSKVALPWLATAPQCFIIRGRLKPEFDASKWHRRLIHPKDGDPATIECSPRRWIPLDIDGAEVPHGLGAPDKLAEAGYHIRDNLLPPYFRGVRCVAAATSSTGRKGLSAAHLRLFFLLNEAADNEILTAWVDKLSTKFIAIAIDPRVMVPNQPIYTARPIFRGCDDPVPEWGRVRLLDGYEDTIVPDLPRVSKKKQQRSSETSSMVLHVCNDMPDWMVEVAKADAGCGVTPIIRTTEISSKAWTAIRQIYEMLEDAPKIYHGRAMGRHELLNRAAYWLARLYDENEIPEEKAREYYWKAAEGINNRDGKYGADLLARHIDDAFAGR